MTHLFRFISLSVLICLPLVNLNAQTKKQVISKTLKAMDDFNDYKASFNYYFKFFSGNDTTLSVIKCEEKRLFGHHAFGTFNKVNKYYTSYAAFDANELCILDTNNNTYYDFFIKENKANFYHKIGEGLYKPLNYKKKYLNEFELLPDTNSTYYILMRQESYSEDSLKDDRSKTIVYVRKSDMLPVVEYEWFWSDGEVQYSKYELLNVANLSHVKLKDFVKNIDSLKKHFRTYHSGDSIWKEFEATFRKLKVGDSVDFIVGVNHITRDSMVLDHKKDSILIIDFSYTTCGPCVKAIPVINSLHRKYNQTGIGVYSVDPFKNDWSRLDRFIEYYKVEYPIIEIDYSFTRQYGVMGYPRFIIIKKGKVAFISGYSDRLEDIIIKEICKLTK